MSSTRHPSGPGERCLGRPCLPSYFTSLIPRSLHCASLFCPGKRFLRALDFAHSTPVVMPTTVPQWQEAPPGLNPTCSKGNTGRQATTSSLIQHQALSTLTGSLGGNTGARSPSNPSNVAQAQCRDGRKQSRQLHRVSQRWKVHKFGLNGVSWITGNKTMVLATWNQ